MKSLRWLSAVEVRTINNTILKQCGICFPTTLLYYLNEKEKLFLVNTDFKKVDERKLIIDRVGLYVGEVKEKEVRLSKEGAQFLGNLARESGVELKNTFDVGSERVKEYFIGEDMDVDLGVEPRMMFVVYDSQVIGYAKYKEGVLHNYHPKQHRGEVIV